MSTTTFYVRLQLVMDGRTTIPDPPIGAFSPAFLKRYSYKVRIAPKPGAQLNNANKTFSGSFVRLRSTEHAFRTSGPTLDTGVEVNAVISVTWEIYFDGKLTHEMSGKLYADPRSASNETDRYAVKFTRATTQWSTGEPKLVVQQVSSGIGWYLVKQAEPFGSLMQRAFKKPSQINWDVMKEVNKHLGEVSTVLLLKPGQVVIISRTKTHSSPALKQMMASAVKAQAAWKEANKDGAIDATEMALMDLLMQGHTLVPIEPGQIDGLETAQALALMENPKTFADSTIGLAGAKFEMATGAQTALVKAANQVPYTTPKGTTKRAVRHAATTAPKPFKLLNDSSMARQLVYWDTGIKADRARDYIDAAVQLRDPKLNGGIPGVADNLGNVGKYSTVLKRAGHVGVLIEVGTTYTKASDAYERGDVKGGNVAVGKGVGSVVGGLGAGAGAAFVITLVFGVATGGVGLVLIGVAAAAAGYYGGKAGEKLGQLGAETINDMAFEK